MPPSTLPTTPAPATDPMAPLFVKVLEHRVENADTFTLTLESPGSSWTCKPGQFNMLYAFGAGEAAISISGDTAQRSTIVHTIRRVGSVTGILDQMRAGQTIGLRGPFGSAWPVEVIRGKDVVVVTGGIGLAPLRPALYYFINHRSDFGRIILFHGSRTPQDLIYGEQLKTWASEHSIEVHLTVDRINAAEKGPILWKGAIGPVTILFPRLRINPANTVSLMCGPEIMMRFALKELEKKGMSHDQVYVTLERNMQCAIGLCGHCQMGPNFICMDGPVFRYDNVRKFFEIREA